MSAAEKTSYRLNIVVKIHGQICNFVFVSECSFSMPGMTEEIPFQLLEVHITRAEAAPAKKQHPPSRRRTPKKT